jgi:hypothetical protein
LARRAPSLWPSVTPTGLTEVKNFNYTSVPTWQSGRRYKVSVRAVDNLNNYQTQVTSTTFIFDNTAPTSQVTRPTEGVGYSLVNPLSTISGTAVDHYFPLCAEVQKIEFSIRRDEVPTDPNNVGSEDYWWNGTQWIPATNPEVIFTADTFYEVVGGTKSWYKVVISSTDWVSGKTYRLKYRAVDFLGNTENWNIRTFYVDNIPPTATIVYPVNGQSYLTITTISGTAVDDSPTSSGVKETEVQLSFIQGSDVYYWKGDAWVTYSTWVKCINDPLTPANTRWYYTSLPSPWTPNVVYTLKARSIDNAGNVQTTGIHTITFSIDNEAPYVLIQQPQHDTGYSPAKPLDVISGTAVDAFSGLDYIEIMMQNLITGKYWDGVSQFNQDNEQWHLVVDTDTAGNEVTTWQYSKSFGWQPGYRYLVCVRGVDKAGNKKPTAAVNNQFVVGIDSNVFTYDNLPPLVYFVRPLESATTPVYSSITSITGTAIDQPTESGLYNSGVAEVYLRLYYISDTPAPGTTYYWNGTEFSSWSYPVNGILITGATSWYYNTTGITWSDGVMYFAEVRAKDNANNWSNWKRQTFIYDSVAPVAPVIRYPSTLRAYDNLPQITGTAYDQHSRISKVQIYLQDLTRGTTYWDNLTSTWVASATPIWFDVGEYNAQNVVWSWSVPSGIFIDGHTYDVKARAYDAANNLGPESSIVRFFQDVSNPYSVVVPPPEANRYYTQIPTISGTSYDDIAGVEEVKIALQRRDNDQWWTGANTGDPTLDWDINPRWLDVTSLSGSVGDKQRSWYVVVGTNAWINGLSYRLRVRTKDYTANAVHYEGGTDLGVVKVEPFYCDKQLPNFACVLPQDGLRYKVLPTISGTAVDFPSGINRVEIAIYRIDFGDFWNKQTNDWSTFIPNDTTNPGVWDTVSFIDISTWVYTKVADNNKWTSGARYYIYVRAIDNAGNISPHTTTWVQLDWIPPVSRITSPTSENVYYSSSAITQVGGTASDTFPGTGITEVRVRIRRSDGAYFDGLGWTGTENSWLLHSSLIAGTPYTWSKDLTGIWQPGYAYYINSRAKDGVQIPPTENVEVNYSTLTYVYDTTLPNVAITNPKNNSWVNTLAQIQGTANDPNVVSYGVPSNIDRVEVAICRLSDGKYWTGSSFSVSELTWNLATITEVQPTSWTWTYSGLSGDLNPYWTDNTSYTVHIRTYDKANNLAYGNTHYFIFDTSAPTSAITYGSPTDETNQPIGYLPSYPVRTTLTSITGTASDYGLGRPDKVMVQIRRVDPTPVKYLAPDFTFVDYTTAVVVNVNADGSWVLDTSAVGWLSFSNYEMQSRAIDKAGNVEPVWSTVRTFRMEPERAKSVITSVQDGKYYKSVSAIGGTATQTPLTERLDIMIRRNTDGYYWSDTLGTWVNYSTWVVIYSPTLPNWSYSHPSLQFVHGSSYTVASKAWRLSPLVAEYDTEPPGPTPNVMPTFWIDNVEPQVTLNLPNKLYVNNLPTISGTADDALSGIDKVELQIQDLKYPSTYWSSVLQQWVDYSTWCVTTYVLETKEWYLTGSTPTWQNLNSYRLTVKAYDKAIPANTYQPASFDFTYDISAPTATITSPVHNSTMSVVDIIFGNWWDLPSNTAVDRTASPSPISVKIQALGGTYAGRFWRDNPPAWVLAETWNNSTDTVKVYSSSWTYIKPSGLVWENNVWYSVVVKIKDIAGNENTNFVVGVSSITFLADITPPQTTITSPNNAYLNYLPTNISGELYDALSGASTVYLILTMWLPNGDTYYWTGASWSSTTIPTPIVAEELSPKYVPGTALWSHPFPAEATFIDVGGYSDKKFNIKVQGIDGAKPYGNVEPWDDGFTFYIDTTPPTVAITYPQNNAKLNFMPVISGTANANLSGLDDVELRISSWVGTGWSLVTTVTKPQVSVYITSFSYQTTGLIDGTTYQVVARAKDKATNWSVVYSTITFIYDIAPPVVYITKPPVDYRYYGNNTAETDYYLDVIKGTFDERYGISKAEVMLFDVTISSYYSYYTNSWQTSSTWSAVGVSDLDWSTGVVKESLTDGHMYRINVRAYDLAGNLSSFPTRYFYYDISEPQVAIWLPSDEYHKALPTVSGTAWDNQIPVNKSNLYRVEIRIQENPPSGNWWDNTNKSFTIPNINKDLAWYIASGITEGSASDDYYVTGVDTPTWVSNKKYRVEVRSVDRARNVSSVVSKEFIFDTESPVVSIVEPSYPAYNYLPTISGTSADINSLGEVDYVKLQIFNYTIGDVEKSWFVPQTTTTVPFEVWFETYTWASGNKYRINAFAVDKAGNYSVEWSTKEFRFDNQAPEAKVLWPAEKFVSTIFDTISGTAKDIPPVAVGDSYGGVGLSLIQIAIRENSSGLWWGGASFNQASPLPFNYTGSLSPEPVVWSYVSSALSSNLQSGVSYYVTLRVRDNALNTAEFFVYGSTFTFDNTPPVSTVISPQVTETYYSSLPTITGTCADLPPAEGKLASGVRTVEFTIQDVTPGVAEENKYWTGSDWTGISPTTFTATSIDNWYTWYSTGTVVPLASAWKQGHRYKVSYWAYDKTEPLPGNKQPTQEVYFKYESSAPVCAFTNITNNTYYRTLPQISGTALDYPLSPLYRSGINRVEVLIKSIQDGTYWNGSSWQTTEPLDWPDASFVSGYDPQSVVDWYFNSPVLEKWKRLSNFSTCC